MTIFSKAGLILGFFCSVFPGFSQSEKASLEGLVLDAATRQPIASATVMGVGLTGKTIQSKSTATDGSFRLELGTKDPFKVVVRAQSYIPHEEAMNFSDGRVNRRTGKIFLLNRAVMPASPVAAAASEPKKTATAPTAERTGTPARPPLTITDQVIELKAIQFVQSTADMVPEAQTDLDRVFAFLTQNPSISIEVAGHTDNQGDFDKNLALSRQRAETVKAFLVNKGIAAPRIMTKGYGGTRPVATNNYEKSRQLNRRVEMRVINR